MKLLATDNVGIDHFECKLDGNKWIIFEKDKHECMYVNLSAGSHTVLVRSVDQSENVDNSPASFRWSVPTIQDSVSSIINEVKKLSLSSIFTANMIYSLNKIHDELTAEGLALDPQVCRQIESFLSANKEAILNEKFEEKFYLTSLGLTLKERIGCPAPIASAGKDLKVNEGSKIKLEASSSRDVYGEELSYVWKQISGPSGSLSNSHSEKPEFKAPHVDKNMDLKFELTVKSSRGLSSKDSTTVTVINIFDDPDFGLSTESGLKNQDVDFGTKGFNIAAIGDWGCNSNTQASASSIARSAPELVLALGDYSYSNTATCWLDIIEPMDSVTRITIGNHEDEPSEHSDAYLDHFGLSKEYYSYDYQQVHVLTLNSEEEHAVGSPQFNFVKNDLELSSNNPNINWIIVTVHEPAYSSPNSLSDTYHPLYDQYGVDLVLEGHVHNYQRSYPISYNSNDPSNPIITDSSKNNYVNPSSSVFAVVGTGGINLHSLAGKATYISNQQDVKFGFLNIYFSADGKTLFAKFIANDGTVPDEFSITKSLPISQSTATPRLNDRSVMLLENSVGTITLNASDIIDPNVKYLIELSPMHGRLVEKKAAVAYKPNKDYVGQDSFTYKAIDEKGSESNIATVTIDVKAVDQAPETNMQMDQGEEEDVTSNFNESNSTQTDLTSPNRDNEDQSSNLQQRKYTGILNSDDDSSTSLKEFELTNPKLSALLTQNNPKTTHKLILDSYANSGETIDAPPISPYPKRPSIVLQTGSLISIVSANPDITFKSTELTLYDKSDLPFYPTSNNTNS